jgi:outer membrane protein assembly factor BamB
MVTILVTLLCVAAAPAVGTEAAHWPQFRGADARGVADGHPTPSEWSVRTGANIRWKTPIPGLAHSSPVVWGERVFVTTAVRGEGDDPLKVGLYGNIEPVEDDAPHRFELYCLDRNTGEVIWKRTAYEGVPRVKRHPKSSHANPTPATDGAHVVAFFGSEGLHAYDMDGKLLWKKDLGLLDAGYFEVPEAQWAYGASPVIHDGKVIVQVDIQKDSFLAAFDVKDGSEIWRTPRADVPTWGTPTVYVGRGRKQVLANGWKHIGGYDLETGEELWKMKGGGDIPVPTPYVAHDLIFLTNAHGGGMHVFAVKTSATGDISLKVDETSNDYVAWSDPKGGSYMPTSLVYGDLLYILRDNGILSCRDARTGELHYRERVGGGSMAFSASLVAADGKVYLTGESGEILVVKAGEAFELLATNEMDETCMATPAIAEGTIFFRTRSHLLAVAEDGGKKVGASKPATRR